MKILLLVLAVCFSRFCHGQLKNCFYLGGSSASIDFPCDPDAEVSACCGAGWRCVSSFYCIGSDGWRVGSCTDRFFNDNACPFQLTNQFPFSYDQNTTFCQDGTVCPNTGNKTCCSAGAGKKEILFHYISPLPTIVKDLTSFYSLAGYSLPSSTTSSSGATISTSPTSTASASASSSSRPESSSPHPSPSSSPTPNSASSGLSSSAKAGIGVGVSLGALLVGLAILFLRRRRRRRRRNMPANPQDPPPPASHWPGFATAGELPGKSAPAEIHGSGRKPAEMYGDPTSAELLGRSSGVRYEL